jgi:GT2 family glycosyltransferase
MIIKNELIKRIGLLDETLSPFFQEDVDYSLRTWEHGYKVFYVGTSKVIHLQSYSFEKRKIPDEKFYLALRNSVIVTKRHFGFWKTLFFGLPIFFSTALLERRDKTKSFSPTNLKFRDGLFIKFLLLVRALKGIFM